jgi:hypothetical protein
MAPSPNCRVGGYQEQEDDQQPGGDLGGAQHLSAETLP